MILTRSWYTASVLLHASIMELCLYFLYLILVFCCVAPEKVAEAARQGDFMPLQLFVVCISGFLTLKLREEKEKNFKGKNRVEHKTSKGGDVKRRRTKKKRKKKKKREEEKRGESKTHEHLIFILAMSVCVENSSKKKKTIPWNFVHEANVLFYYYYFLASVMDVCSWNPPP